ncbi:putative oxoglutarate/iron-dependent dioxygenase, isopenicillin N synthase [Rosa chinensis]|uniref:Putative oxoglutarate/iron-dependent dioxygenase, isopenicillin N synthase n=1 Tax=Rosa chinensis TaxID=74649 RepID=A0A2P6QQN2_ROSCH|nr:putative oxoglutarate/iron-dependent dioxygenase, isopenicillin N synthase [Rosa chinensis]
MDGINQKCKSRKRSDRTETGLQIQYQNKWIDVPPMPEALVVNVGDFLQARSLYRISSARWFTSDHFIVFYI